MRPAQCRAGRIRILCEALCHRQAVPLDRLDRHTPLALSRADETLLFVLEDIAGGPPPGSLEVSRADFINLLELHAGRELRCAPAPPLTVNKVRLATRLKLTLEPADGALRLSLHTELPFAAPDEQPVYVVAGRSGWVYGAGNFWPLENLVPLPYHALYESPVRIERPDVLRFFRHELDGLARHARLETDLTLDLFTIEPAAPRFRLLVRGSPASLSATLYARYDGLELVAAKPDAREHFAIPDPHDPLRYTVRNLPAETEALHRLRAAGFLGDSGDALAGIVGRRQVLNFLGAHLPALRRRGWTIELEGRIAPFLDSAAYATPVVRIRDANAGWFDVSFEFEDDAGRSLAPADIHTALNKGDAFLDREGGPILFDADAVVALQGVFEDCAVGEGAAPGHFRMSNVYGAFVKSSLDALDGVDVEAGAAWLERARRANRQARVEPVPIGAPLEARLRQYQKEGVYWLRFLETNGLCGLLADEMGLGKTVQTLAWLRLPRVDPALRGKPALIVCPTSLVENWLEEAARFTPDLRAVNMTGADRHERWELAAQSDLLVTSYALLRRDVERLAQIEFSAVVLDEAQHIKNRSTQNALAAKQLRAPCRLVLTGTPVENSVSDLWSIMDFLMPGYLGPHDLFRARYEQPIARQDDAGAAAQLKLRRKLQPFLLRRLKRDVARDLPPKIERVSFCSLTGDQQLVYAEMLNRSRRRLADLVAARGFNACRMEVLTTLLRLRQICCHLELLPLPGLKPAYPSAKLDLFFELLDEAIDGQHRVLVFSQFVSMLRILRRELDRRAIPYCYLDGATQERLPEIHRFHTRREIPVFLISLKAGGTGLNLTGADTVIHFDPWWNPAVEDQATDRAYRIGQQRTVYSIKLITRGTVEEKVLALQQRKQTVIDATLASDRQIAQALTWNDVREILAL